MSVPRRMGLYSSKTSAMQRALRSLITSPGHETPLTSGVSTNVSVDVNTRQHDSEADVDARQHDPGEDQDQPAFNRLWNNQYAALTELICRRGSFVFTRKARTSRLTHNILKVGFTRIGEDSAVTPLRTYLCTCQW
eukprot:scaffold23321_cov107-Amphora_coffeaeformis.AAC.3